MYENYTTKEQSEKLVKLNIDKKSADMHYITDPYGSIHVGLCYRDWINDEEPCWSLGALIKLLPESVYNQKHETSFIRQLNVNDVVYENTLVFNSKETLFENVYDAVCFFATHGFSTRYGYFDDAK